MAYSDFTLKKVKADFQLKTIDAPAITIVEVKNEGIISGLCQCIA
ncbi:MAG: hypothetical protein ACTFAL_14690 [Candidatus Electronema sp. V4]